MSQVHNLEKAPPRHGHAKRMLEYERHDRQHATVRSLSWLVLVCGIGAACTKPNPAVCCDSPGDCSALGIHETQRPCEAGFVCADHQCVAASTCSSDTDCDGLQPHCASNGVCVECDAAEHCPSSQPTCDAVTKVCRACQVDDDCESAVCDASAGTCVPQATILYAAPSGADSGDCEQASPCSIARAIGLAGGARTVVKLAPGSYTGGFEIAGRSITIFGAGATLNAASGVRALRVVDSGQLRIVGLKISSLGTGAGGQAIACETTNGGTTPIVDLQSVQIEATQPIVVNPCTMTIARSRVHALGGSSGSNLIFASGINAPATLTIDRSTLDGGAEIVGFPGSIVRISNSVIANVAGPSSTSGALSSSGRLHVSFSTVINSPIKCSTGTSEWPPCAVGGGGYGVCFDNSIILNTDPSAPADTITGKCVADYTMVYPQATTLVGANNRIGVNPVLADVAGGNYHLSPLSPAIDAADPAASAGLDFDGTERPQGQRLDMGAFEFKP